MCSDERNRYDLIKYARVHSPEISLLPESYKEFFGPDKNLCNADEWINAYRKDKGGIITVDVRSEAEFAEDHLPGAVNFPILDNIERDEVGFLYKQVSPKAALYRALGAAGSKAEMIRDFCSGMSGKDIFVYCWRGGGRSSAACKYFSDYVKNCIKIEDGYKAYRREIFRLFYEDPSELNFVVLSGLTGCGKTEIIEHMTGKVPVFDIEKAAGHASSLFGHIRYEVKTSDIPQSQLQFENRLFEQVISNNNKGLPFLTESESKRISKFNIPDALHKRLLDSPLIEIASSMDNRIRRIVQEYFSDGSERVYSTLKNSEFLKKILGREKTSGLLKMLDEGEVYKFCEWFLTEYYDKRYSGKYKNRVGEISNDDTNKAAFEIEEYLKKML